jgi:charged multivesicular body protein 3
MSNLVDMIIGKRLTPEEQVKKWRATIRTQERELDKTIRQIDQEQQKAKKMIKQAAKRNDLQSCKILAKEVVNSNKAKNRIITSKAQLNSLVMQMQQQLGNLIDNIPSRDKSDWSFTEIDRCHEIGQ